MPSSGEVSKEKILEKADNSGFPLQRYCSQMLNELGWSAKEEFPVSLGRRDYGKSVETVGDMYATKVIDNGYFHLILECKRKFLVPWNFFRSINPTKECVFPELAIVGPPDLTHKYYAVLPNSCWLQPPPNCSMGWEMTEGRKEKTENDTVRRALKQCWTATLSTLEGERMEMDDLLGEGNDLPHENEVFIPVVVTGAKLFELSSPGTNYRIGNLGGEPKQLDYLALSFAVPSYLRWKIESPVPGFADRYDISSPDIYVVNYESLRTFAVALSDAIESAKGGMYPPPGFFSR